MPSIEAIANSISALSAFVAAGLWFYSTKVKAKPEPDEPDGSGPFQITDDDNGGEKWDVLATAALQVTWNRKAAVATGVAALAQAIALFSHGFSN